ncbi:MAG: hypothetical protein GQ544_05215 [Candidatus Aminicenantes bacterium]|nr:hypothetical protein [Candidatus Aminicenantes bacterium]
MKKRLTLKISISGVRGVVGDSLTPQLVARFALAFGSYQGRGKILVGQDARASGVMIKNAVFSGLLSVGCQPVDVGICPIPSFLVLTKDNSAIGGIVVTASHNPKDWNGLKFISGEGLYLNPSQIQEFLDIYHQGEFTLVPADKHKNLLIEKNPTDSHLQKLMNTLDVEGIRRKKILCLAWLQGKHLLAFTRVLSGCIVSEKWIFPRFRPSAWMNTWGSQMTIPRVSLSICSKTSSSTSTSIKKISTALMAFPRTSRHTVTNTKKNPDGWRDRRSDPRDRQERTHLV